MHGTISRLRFRWMNVRDRLLAQSPSLLTRTLIRGITALLALISFACFAGAIPLWDRNLEHTSGPSRGDWQDGIPIAPLAVAFLYNVYTTIYAIRTAQRNRFALEAIVDFLIWAVLVPALVFAVWGGVFNVWRSDDNDSTMVIDCDSVADYFSKTCSPELYVIGMLELAGITFGIPVWMLHVFLFTHGFIERCRRSRLTKQQRAAEMIKDLEDGSTATGKWENYPRMPPRSYLYS